MTDKEKIRAEIERLKESGCASPIVICDTLLAFIDSMQEEPVSEDLQKASMEFAKGFGEWHYAMPCFQAGAKWHKQQMMKDAIEGIVTTNIDGWINVMTGFIRPKEAGANFGDKVKLIIIKEDGI